MEVGDDASGRHQGVAGGPLLRGEGHLEHGQQVLEVPERARPDQRCGDPPLILGPEDRELGRSQAGVGRDPGEPAADVDAGSGDPVGVEAAAQRGPRALGIVGVAEIAAREYAHRHRRPGDDAEAEALAHRDQFVLDPAVQQVVGRLLAGEAGVALQFARHHGLGDHPGRVGRAADVADLAGPDQVVQRPQGFVERHLGRGAMQLIEVDVVGLQALRSEPSQARIRLIREWPYSLGPMLPV